MELLVVLILVGCVLLTGGLLAVTPWLMPKTECFAVTVPEGARRDPRLAGFRRRYALIVGVATLACSGIPDAAPSPGSWPPSPPAPEARLARGRPSSGCSSARCWCRQCCRLALCCTFADA